MAGILDISSIASKFVDQKFVTLDAMSSYTAVLANYINSKVKIDSISYDEDSESVIIKTYDDTITIPLTELKVDNKNIILDTLKRIALADDIKVKSVTTTSDGKGINWKSQELLASTTSDHKIVLLFKQDTEKTNGIGVIGGELLETGSGTYGHYELSVVSTGSRFIKGSTTVKDKAKLVLAKYESTYYYGIKLKSEEDTNVYFAGWKNVPDALCAPDFSTYKDEDVSDVVELNDDSDTGVQVIDWTIDALSDVTWEFEDGPETISTTTESISPSTNTMANASQLSLKLSNNDGSSVTGYFNEIKSARLYAIMRTNNANQTKNGYYYIRQGNGTQFIIGIDEDNLQLTIVARTYGNNRTLRIYKAASSDGSLVTTGSALFSGTIGSDDTTLTATLPKGDYVISATSSIYYKSFDIVATTISADNALSGWTQGGNNDNYDFGDSLYLNTESNTTWYSSSINNNAGYIIAASNTDSAAFKLDVKTACTVTVGYVPIDSSATIKMSESTVYSKATVSSTSSDSSVISSCSYVYDGSNSTTVYIFNSGAVNFMYVQLTYYDDGMTNGEKIVKVILSLPETGETGSPHVLRPHCELTKADIILIAHNLLNQKKQISLDLSGCTVASDATDWRTDSDLNKAFQGNSSLREFYYPEGVEYSGGMTFLNCQFLEKIVFSSTVKGIGMGTTWTSANTGFMSGCRCSEIFLPKNMDNDWGGYFFAQNNCLSYFFYPYNKMFKDGVLPSSFNWIWNTFSLARGDFKFYLPSHQTSTGTWATTDSDGECYNQWKDISKSFASTINVSLSDVMTNVDPLENSDNWTEFVEPYDVNLYFTSEQLAKLASE